MASQLLVCSGSEREFCLFPKEDGSRGTDKRVTIHSACSPNMGKRKHGFRAKGTQNDGHNVCNFVTRVMFVNCHFRPAFDCKSWSFDEDSEA